MHYFIFIHHKNIFLFKNFERGFLRNNECVYQWHCHLHISCFAMPQQSFRVREGCPESNVSSFIVKVGFNGLNNSNMIEHQVIGHQQVYLHQAVLLFTHSEIQVFSFWHVEVNPHLTVVRHGGEQVSLIHKTSKSHLKTVHDTIKGSSDFREPKMNLSQRHFCFCFIKFCLG